MGPVRQIVNSPYLPAWILAAPTILVIAARGLARPRKDAQRRRDAWIGFRGWYPVLDMVLLLVWWRLWDARGPLEIVLPGKGDSRLLVFSAASYGFWLLPVMSVFAYSVISSYFSTATLRIRRGIGTRIGMILANVAESVAPILLLESAADELLNRSAWGFVYLAAAAAMWKVGSLLSLAATGMRFNTLKSGETLGRARRIAHQMGVELERVYMVPAGRGKLVNAYSLGNSIAISDSLGQHLKRSEIEFTIAHEVGHCKRKHGLRFMRLGVTLYLVTAAVLFGLGDHTGRLRWFAAIAGVVIPVLICKWFSRRNEYEADAEAVGFTHAPESGIRGLSNLADAIGIPKNTNSMATVLHSHPLLRNRAAAIARVGNLSDEQLKSILREEGILE